MLPEDAQGQVRYISPKVMNEVRKRLSLLDLLETQMADIRAMMLHLISEDTKIDLERETWAIDLDHGCVEKQGVAEGREESGDGPANGE
jgi:hypothetical protein